MGRCTNFRTVLLRQSPNPTPFHPPPHTPSTSHRSPPLSDGRRRMAYIFIFFKPDNSNAANRTETYPPPPRPPPPTHPSPFIHLRSARGRGARAAPACTRGPTARTRRASAGAPRSYTTGRCRASPAPTGRCSRPPSRHGR